MNIQSEAVKCISITLGYSLGESAVILSLLIHNGILPENPSPKRVKQALQDTFTDQWQEETLGVSL
jgi:hypothetical protein